MLNKDKKDARKISNGLRYRKVKIKNLRVKKSPL